MIPYLKVVITPALLDSKSRIIELRDVYVTEHRNNFNGVDSDPMIIYVRLSPATMVQDGITIISKYWKVTDSNAAVVATTTTEAPTPNVISLDWIHPETKETITETTYTEKIALTAQIENAESTTAKIFITKEDGTEFENGETELLFEEAITEEGTVELTALEIKEQWQEFKTADIDKLVAKIDHNGYQKKSGKLTILPAVEVVAHFRPITGWNGEKYGFDWIRTGDSGLAGDTAASAYKDIIGRHEILDATGALVPAGDGQIKDGLATFVKEQTTFNTYKAAFNPIPIPWKLDSAGNPEDYYVPWLSILRIPTTHPDYDPAKPDPIIDLVLNIEVKTAPERIKIKYENKCFELSSPGATVEKDKAISYLVLPASAKSIGSRKINLNLKNLHTLSDDLKIEVIAEEKQTGGTIIDKSVGEVMVVGNAKKHRKKVKILLVNVKTNITGTIAKGLSPANSVSVESMLKKFLNQALIIPSYKKENLDLSSNVIFNAKYNIGGVFSPSVLHSELDRDFFFDDPINPTVENPAKSKYKDYFRIYFIGEACGSGSYGQAEAIGADTCIVYCDGLTDTTAAHELYHAMGLYHSFSNLGTFTYDYAKTDCIMDYSDIETPAIPVIQFYKWQWDILKGNAKVKTE